MKPYGRVLDTILDFATQLLLLEDMPEAESTDEGQPDTQLEIYLNALTGRTVHKTMRVHAKVGVRVMNALIDSGSPADDAGFRMRGRSNPRKKKSFCRSKAGYFGLIAGRI